MDTNLILLICLLLASIWTVMTVRLIRAVVGLALTSAVLSIVMFRLNSPLAAVFELSVCAGLIFVIFIITVSFAHRLTEAQMVVRRKEHFAKFKYLPFIIAATAIILYYFTRSAHLVLFPAGPDTDVRLVLWNKRHLDLFGQVSALLAAAVGVAVLFKGGKR